MTKSWAGYPRTPDAHDVHRCLRLALVAVEASPGPSSPAAPSQSLPTRPHSVAPIGVALTLNILRRCQSPWRDLKSCRMLGLV